MLTFETPSRFCCSLTHDRFLHFGHPRRMVFLRRVGSRSCSWNARQDSVKPQIPPDLSHFHMRNYVLLVGILGLKQLFEM